MPETRSEFLVLSGYGGTTTDATATVVSLDPPERAARALKGAGLAWGAAAVSVFIPLAHFLLVPGFALAGVVIFIKRTRLRETVESIHGICPDCGHEQDFDCSGRWRPPGHLGCGNCGRLLRARPLSTGP